MSAMAATGAALRLHLLFRMLRVGELLALAALISWSSCHAPSAAAAAVRVAGSLLFSPRFVFVLGNAIVLLLLALSRRERDSSPVSSATNHPATGAGVAVDQMPAVPAADSFPSYAAPAIPTPEREGPAAVVATSAPEVVPLQGDGDGVRGGGQACGGLRGSARRPEQGPRAEASRSEKMSPRGVGSRRAASPGASS
ncbi:hypothetical protein ACQ4PT_052071 [Festuca glaucescens]